MRNYVTIDTISHNEYDNWECYEFSNGWSAEYQEVETPDYTRWQWVLIPLLDAGTEDRFYPDTWDELICLMQVEGKCFVSNMDGTPVDGKLSKKRTQEMHEYKWHDPKKQKTSDQICDCDDCRRNR
jgi:hypothetical protein